jgi:hypothetical protein
MATLTIWWVAISLEVLLVFRAVSCRIVRKYPFFFLYLISVLLSDISLYYIHVAHPALYSGLSRQADVLNIVLGYGIVLEIFTHVLSHYAGVERFARIAGLALFALVLCFAMVFPLVSPETQGHFRYSIVERDFLAVQAIFLFGVLGIISYYRIEPGKNIKGMTVGYGIWLGTSVIMLALGSYNGSSFNQIRVLIQPLSYLLSLVIWMATLWRYAPMAVSAPQLGRETDYALLVATTTGVIGKMRTYIARSARS